MEDIECVEVNVKLKLPKNWYQFLLRASKIFAENLDEYTTETILDTLRSYLDNPTIITEYFKCEFNLNR